MNIELAEKVLDHASRFPDSFDMGDWWYQDEWDGASTEPWKCGTTACIAGWAMYLSGEVTFRDGQPLCDGGYEELGADLLGISLDDAQWLFYLDEGEAINALHCLIDEAKAEQ